MRAFFTFRDCAQGHCHTCPELGEGSACDCACHAGAEVPDELEAGVEVVAVSLDTLLAQASRNPARRF